MKNLTLSFVAIGLSFAFYGCGSEPPVETNRNKSPESKELKQMEKRVDLLQKRQREDRKQLLAHMTALQESVDRLEGLLENKNGQALTKVEATKPDALTRTTVSPVGKPTALVEPLAVKTISPEIVPDRGASRVRVRGTVQSLQDDYIDPPKGPAVDWFPLTVRNLVLKRSQTGERVMTRVEKTGQMVRDENGQMRPEEIRLQEKVPMYTYTASVRIKGLLKSKQQVQLSAGTEKVRVELDPGEEKSVSLSAVPNSPLVVESGRWNRSFPIPR